MDATRRLEPGTLRVEFDHNVLEIADALLGVAQSQVAKGPVGALFAVDGEKFTGDCLHK
jgi:hypothetical protein